MAPDGKFRLEWAGTEPYWLFLHQRIHPQGGPPLDLFLPDDLAPRTEPESEPVVFEAIDPDRLWERDRWSSAPDVLARLIGLCLAVMGLGLAVRWGLRAHTAPEGLRSAPLYDRPRPPAPNKGELAAALGLLAVAAALRLRGMSSQSLDLLEVSYLPGIGRPTPAAGLGEGLAGLGEVLRETAALYCLDLVHPPLYHGLLGVAGLFGTQDAWLRLPAFLASLATAILVWQLFRRASPGLGLGAMALFALSAPAIYFGQDATPYAALSLAAIGSVLLALRALGDGRSRTWFLFFLVLVLGFLCHYAIALVGLGEIGLLVVLALRNRSDRRWAAAARRATGPALLLAPIPLLWSWAHFSTFPTVAQHTRLVADTYPQAEGLLPYLWDFVCVTAGVEAGHWHWAAAAGAVLAILGLRKLFSDGPTREVALLLCALLAAFLFSVVLFYVGVSDNLGGRIFYGFRWVSWFQPVLLGLAVVGIAQGSGPVVLRATLAALWLLGLGHATGGLLQEPARPDYEGAAQIVRAELQDLDGFATLPAWFQRGNLAHYLGDGAVPPDPHSPNGAAAWQIDSKRFLLEAIHVSLPFESTARGGHLDRLWVAVVDERMFGRPKFSPAAARAAVEWADEHLVREAEWQLDRLQLIRYRIPRDREPTLAKGATLSMSSESTVLDHRTYPMLDEDHPVFRPGSQIAPLQNGLGPSPRLQAPRTPSCVEWDWGDLRRELDPEAPHHWYLAARVPVGEGRGQPVVLKEGPAQVQSRMEGGSLRITAVGEACDRPPLVLKILSPEAAAKLQ